MCCLPFSRLSICSLVKLVLFLCSFRFNRSRNCESSSPEELCSELPSEVFSWSRSPPPGYPKTVLLLFINARPHALQPYLPLINKYKGKTFSRLGTVVQKQSLQLQTETANIFIKKAEKQGLFINPTFCHGFHLINYNCRTKLYTMQSNK